MDSDYNLLPISANTVSIKSVSDIDNVFCSNIKKDKRRKPDSITKFITGKNTYRSFGVFL